MEDKTLFSKAPSPCMHAKKVKSWCEGVGALHVPTECCLPRHLPLQHTVNSKALTVMTLAKRSSKHVGSKDSVKESESDAEEEGYLLQ